jgi:hypothetical protein
VDIIYEFEINIVRQQSFWFNAAGWEIVIQMIRCSYVTAFVVFARSNSKQGVWIE